jgi:hypothetical protein
MITTPVIDIKKQNREALKWILGIRDLRKNYFDSLAEFSTLGAAVGDGMPRNSDTGNPCANKAISLIEMERQKTWIQVIELMEHTLSEKRIKYLELRRDAEEERRKMIAGGYCKRGRPGWVEYVQPRYAEWFEQRYKKYSMPDKENMINWMNSIIDVTKGIAIGKGILI